MKGCVRKMGEITNYTSEYKKEIIKLVTEQGKSRAEVALRRLLKKSCKLT